MNSPAKSDSKKAKLAKLKALRGIGHQLSPIVTIGAGGISPSVVEETARALNDHELIKIKLPAGTSDARKACAQALADATDSEVVHHIGRMALLYRINPNANDKLSNLSRFGM